MTTSHGAGCLLLHGLGSCSFDWSGVNGLLTGPVVLPEAPFHGGRGDDTDLDFEAFAVDALRAADAAGLDELVIGGISMGAATALTIASLEPARVRGVLAVAPAWVRTPEPDNLRRLQKVGRIIERHGIEQAWSVMSAVPPVSRWAPADRDAYRRRFLAADATATARAMIDLPGRLPRLDLGWRRPPPAIVATWAGDPIHPVEAAAEIGAVLDVEARVLDRPADRADEVRLLAGLLHELLAVRTGSAP